MTKKALAGSSNVGSLPTRESARSPVRNRVEWVPARRLVPLSRVEKPKHMIERTALEHEHDNVLRRLEGGLVHDGIPV